MKMYNENMNLPFEGTHLEAAKIFLNADTPLYIRCFSAENPSSFIPAFINHLRTIEELIICTYNISIDSAQLIESCLKYISGPVYILFNTNQLRMASERMEKVIGIFDNYPEQIYYDTANVHSKTISIKSPDKKIIIEGSGNLAQNSNLEQFTISSSEALYKLNKSCILGCISSAAHALQTQTPKSNPFGL